mmetsp:Transcript_29127/g.85181  ORF Transcript_29127/g.85181 Transcript_29127/m.85181 type:complete len:210 (-) Transcript_29127:46-675(-)|eukprot:7381229-Prymnesium_polylepis.1
MEQFVAKQERVMQRSGSLPHRANDFTRKADQLRRSQTEENLALKDELTQQALQSGISKLQASLKQSQSVDDAVRLLADLRRFLRKRDHLTLCDAEALLEWLRRTVLPFEKRRRSPSNPIDEYLVQRSNLEELLEAERKRRGLKARFSKARLSGGAVASFLAIPADKANAAADLLRKRGTMHVGVLSFRGAGHEAHPGSRFTSHRTRVGA